ncbi:hypothetical protein BJ944DRAFT_230349 [Cunninghamella echinulata]|nr:hypothetical protein BJ944DRAFT_230349 [Cunninghamella echinulata]
MDNTKVINYKKTKNKKKGCSLLQSTLYCFGGFLEPIVNRTVSYKTPVNEHVYIDLSIFNNFTTYDPSKINWQTNISNTLNGTPLEAIGRSASAPVLSDNSYLLFGGASALRREDSNMQYPFLNYNPQLNVWKTLPLPPGNNYTDYGNIINLGNDTIWAWGGYQSSFYSPNILNIFDYKTSTWTTQTQLNWPVKISFTSTLANDGNVYILGGYSRSSDGKGWGNDTFSQVIQFQTQTSQWNFFNASGDKPTDRRYHTVTQIPNKNLLIIYGGLDSLYNGFSFQDTCHVYDYTANTFTKAAMPTSTSNHRFGHYATIYDNNYLVLAFGFADATTPANSLSVLNITDPLQPSWITTPTHLDQDYESYHGLNKASLIAIIVVVVIVVLSKYEIYIYITPIDFFSIFLMYIGRHKKRQKKKQFVLEQEDPRKILEGNNIILKPDEDDQYHHEQIRRSEHLGLLHNDTQQSIKPYEDQTDNVTTITSTTATNNTHTNSSSSTKHKPFGED